MKKYNEDELQEIYEHAGNDLIKFSVILLFTAGSTLLFLAVSLYIQVTA